MFYIAVSNKLNYYMLIGPCGIFALIYFGSLPIMEKRQLERRKELYKDYMERVSFKILPISFLYKKSINKTK